MEYLIVHRADEIYKLRFDYEAEELYLRVGTGGIFHPIEGWSAERVMSWLEERSFEHYWERDND